MLRRLLALSLLVSWTASAQPSPPADPYSVEAILAELTRITGLKAKAQVPYATLSRTQLREFLDRRVKELTKPEEIRAEELTLKKFGLVPQDFDLLSSTLELMTEQAAAFYDDQQKKMFLLEGASGMMQQIALVHELAHALADQHFDLGSFIRTKGKTDDATMARMAVAEGQAMWLMTEHTARRAGQSIATAPVLFEMMSRASEMSAGQFPSFDKAPLYLRESLLFPYVKGMAFQHAVFTRSAQASFSEVFRNPPVSTQQILHPERYFANLRPTDPKPPAIPSPRDYRVLAEGSVGEFDHSVLLRQFLPNEDTSALLANWRGGSFHLHEKRSGGPLVLSYVSEWATPEAARDYFRLYRRVLAGKWSKLEATAETDTLVTGRGDDGAFRLACDGRLVTSLEGLPEQP